MNSPKMHRIRIAGLVGMGIVLGAAMTLALVVGLNGFEGHSTDEVAGQDLESSRSASSGYGEDLGDLEFLVETPSVFSRTESLYSLLRSADKKVLSKLLEQSDHIQSEHLRHTTQVAIVQRLVTMDSRLAFSSIDELPNHRHNPLISAAFEEWSTNDLNTAIAYAKTLDEPRRLAALEGFLGSAANQSKDSRDGLVQQLGFDVSALPRGSWTSQSQTTEDFAIEWQEMIADDLHNLAQTASLIRMAHDWVDQSGFDAIAQIAASLPESIVKKVVLGSVLHRAMLEDPHSTLQESLKLDEDLREMALATIARAWASIGPQTALQSISAIDSNRIRRQMFEHFVIAWASYDPKGMLADFDLVPANLRTLAEEHAIRALANNKPAEAALLLAKLSDPELRFDLTLDLAERWSDQDVYVALDWVLSETISDSFLEVQVFDTVLRKLAQENPDLALQTALDLPDKHFLGFEATVIEEVARVNLGKAIAMLSQVREGVTRSSAYTAVGKALVRNNETDRAMEFAQQLPEEERDFYYGLVVNEWAYSNPESLVSAMDKLPSEEAKWIAAMDLTRRNVGTNLLSKDQMAYVREFLPEDYNSETGRREGGTGSNAMQGLLMSGGNREMTNEERQKLFREIQRALLEGRYGVYRNTSP